jgi:hypothetical protein
MKPLLQLEGRSGCKIETLIDNGAVMVRKYSSDFEYNERLCKQAMKQRAFASTDTFKTPIIKNIVRGSSDQLAYVEMEYINGLSYSEYLESITINELHTVIEASISFIQNSFHSSSLAKVDNEQFYQKAESVYKLLEQNVSIELPKKVLTHLLHSKPEGELPIGSCHGDFTLSNMLFKTNTIYLFDFLDSFVESPIIDYVKLRQDTCFGWSIFIEKKLPIHRSNKLKQTLKYWDTELVKYGNKDPYIQKWYWYLQVFNFYRILPYLKSDIEVKFVESILSQLLLKPNQFT